MGAKNERRLLNFRVRVFLKGVVNRTNKSGTKLLLCCLPPRAQTLFFSHRGERETQVYINCSQSARDRGKERRSTSRPFSPSRLRLPASREKETSGYEADFSVKKIEGKQGHVLQTNVRVNVILYLMFSRRKYMFVTVCLYGWMV